MKIPSHLDSNAKNTAVLGCHVRYICIFYIFKMCYIVNKLQIEIFLIIVLYLGTYWKITEIFSNQVIRIMILIKNNRNFGCMYIWYQYFIYYFIFIYSLSLMYFSDYALWILSSFSCTLKILQGLQSTWFWTHMSINFWKRIRLLCTWVSPVKWLAAKALF